MDIWQKLLIHAGCESLGNAPDVVLLSVIQTVKEVATWLSLATEGNVGKEESVLLVSLSLLHVKRNYKRVLSFILIPT